MFKKLLSLVPVLCLIALLLLPGCKAENENTVRIGAIYPLSGAQAETGAAIRQALLLSVDIINRKHDLSLPLAETEGIETLHNSRIELVFADSQGSETVARSEALRLIEKEKVTALIGCYHSAVTAAASQVAEEKGIPFIADISTAPSLTNRGYKWFFRTSPGDDMFVQSYMQFLKEVMGENGPLSSKAAIVYEDSIWGSEFAGYVRQYAEKEGYSIVEDVAYSSSSRDVSAEVEKLKQAGPDLIFQASYTADAILFMQAYKQKDVNPSAILTIGAGFDDPAFVTSLGEDSNFVFSREVWSDDWAGKNPLAGSVSRLFSERYGAEMNSDSSRAFTALSVLADALNRAASVSPEDVRTALLETDLPAGKTIMPWKGVKFDPATHQNVLAGNLVCQMLDRQYRTVWPPDRATAAVVWPVPEWSARALFRVAMIFDSPVADDAFSTGCLRGLENAQMELGISLDFSVSTSEGETQSLIRRYAGDCQHELVICIGSSQSESLKNVYKNYPQQRFALVDGDIAGQENVVSLLARDQESSFLVGAAAALKSASGRIGFIGGMDLPSIRRFLAGYQAGARYIRPDCEVIVDFAGNWLNDGVTYNLALQQHQQGVDVIYAPAGAGSLGMIEAAAENGFYALGVDTDQSYAAPQNVLASAVKNMDAMVYNLIKSEYRGGKDSGIITQGLKEGGVGIAFNSALVTPDVELKIREIENDIIRGKIMVPEQ